MKPYEKPYKQKCPNSVRIYLSECEIDPEAEIEEVELLVAAGGIDYVEEYPIYPFQLVERNADGTGRIRMRVPITDTLQREIMFHAREVTVVKPLRLKEAIIESFRKVAAMYAEDLDEAPAPEAKPKPKRKPKSKKKASDEGPGTGSGA